MSVETILSYLNSCTSEHQISFQIASQCAPVLKGIKAANLITAPKGALRLLQNRLKGSHVICVSLYSGENKDVLFLYRYQMLKKHFRKSKVQNFLKKYGYTAFDVASVLIQLRKRYEDFAEGRRSFPHELGVILEYPVEDVEGFIRNEGENYLLSGYWKVYHDREASQLMFRRYDEAREHAMRQMMQGYSLFEIAAEADLSGAYYGLRSRG